MADQFSLKVYSPAGLALETVTDEVLLPGSDGEIGILPNHARYTGLLGKGAVRYRAEGKSNFLSVKVSGGFSHFADDELSILADKILEA